MLMNPPTIECEVCGRKGLLRVADAKKSGLCNWDVTYSIPMGWMAQSFGKAQRVPCSPVIHLWCSMECLCRWADEYAAAHCKKNKPEICIGV